MSKLKFLKAVLAGGVCAIAFAPPASAENFSIPAGELNAALNAYSATTGVQLVVSADAVRGVRTRGVSGDLSANAALTRILVGTGFVAHHNGSAAVIMPSHVETATAGMEKLTPMRVAAATASSAVESVVVTSSKIKGDIQTVPIAITALSQEQLTARQIAGGPDLVKEVPNLTFTKTNFTGYSIQIRGIGTQAISVTTDPAVAVAFNDIPFIRNHFFEQEFYDVGQVEVLRGPQGTLYGRNATAGVVNVISAKPTDQFESMASADFGNYHNRRFEGMINVPIVDDRLDLRVAAEWTKRDGYSFNALTNSPIDGRDLWSSRVTLGWKPSQNLQTYLVWEHFQENDDRIRSGKQLCKNAPIPGGAHGGGIFQENINGLSQGCLPASFYSPEAFEVPNGYSLPYLVALSADVGLWSGADPYASVTQSRNLRVIESQLDPKYKARNDIAEFNADYTLSPSLTLTSQTAYNQDFLWGTQDYNRFNTSPGAFLPSGATRPNQLSSTGVFCDPQLGCSDRLVAQDLSTEHAWQLSQEFRLTSNFSGPLNFSAGGNYLHYETEENYYVFINALTLFASVGPPEGIGVPAPWVPNVSTNSECLQRRNNGGYTYPDPTQSGILTCIYIDPGHIDNLDDSGHNYFLSQNPYVLNSYAGFGEANFAVTNDLKLTAGLRWTEDQKHFVIIPSEVLTAGYGYPTRGATDQKWGELTGRLNATWTPKLDFTDQTLLYSSYAHGYKAGGANPPGAILLQQAQYQPVHPLTFKPEFVDAYELGTKNTLFDGAMTINGDIFYYDYKAYQISEIVDRTAINLNFDAKVKGAELEATWEPAPGLKFNFAGGYEDARLAKGDKAVDLMDRTDSAHHPDWVVVRPDLTEASNCIFPKYVVDITGAGSVSAGSPGFCTQAYSGDRYGDGSHFGQLDPVTQLPYVDHPTVSNDPHSGGIPPAGYPGFDPTTAPNDGAGFDKDLSNNEMPNAPPFTVSLGAEYTIPISEDWAASVHSDFYWQADSWWRVFNDMEYDRLHGYSTVNLALILTSANGWQVMLYDKNVFNTTAITGGFLNSDDTGLTTNVFLTDPRLLGVRVTKNW